MVFVNQRTHLIVFFATQSGGFAREKKCWWDTVLTHFVSLQMVPAGVVHTYCSNIQTRTFIIIFFYFPLHVSQDIKKNVDAFSAEGEKRPNIHRLKSYMKSFSHFSISYGL